MNEFHINPIPSDWLAKPARTSFTQDELEQRLVVMELRRLKLPLGVPKAVWDALLARLTRAKQ